METLNNITYMNATYRDLQAIIKVLRIKSKKKMQHQQREVSLVQFEIRTIAKNHKQ